MISTLTLRVLCAILALSGFAVPIHASGARERTTRPPERSDWSAYLGDGQRSGVTSAEVALPLVERWRHHARRRPRPSWPAPAAGSFWQRLETLEPRVVHDRAFHVVASGGRVYFGSSSEDQVFCLDGASGSVLWSFFTDGPIRFAPALAEGRLYVGSDDGHVYCLDAISGALEWRYRAAPNGRQVVGNGRLISAWPVRTGVVVDDGEVLLTAGLFPSQGVYAACLNATDGTVISVPVYQAFEAIPVKVAVFDLSGRRLRQLADGRLPKGLHELEWDGRDDRGALVAPGTYICSIQIESQTETWRRVLTLAVVY